MAASQRQQASKLQLPRRRSPARPHPLGPVGRPKQVEAQHPRTSGTRLPFLAVLAALVACFLPCVLSPPPPKVPSPASAAPPSSAPQGSLQVACALCVLRTPYLSVRPLPLSNRPVQWNLPIARNSSSSGPRASEGAPILQFCRPTYACATAPNQPSCAGSLGANPQSRCTYADGGRGT